MATTILTIAHVLSPSPLVCVFLEKDTGDESIAFIYLFIFLEIKFDFAIT